MVGIHKRKILREKVRKHAIDQEKKIDSRKKEGKHCRCFYIQVRIVRLLI